MRFDNWHYLVTYDALNHSRDNDNNWIGGEIVATINTVINQVAEEPIVIRSRCQQNEITYNVSLIVCNHILRVVQHDFIPDHIVNWFGAAEIPQSLLLGKAMIAYAQHATAAYALFYQKITTNIRKWHLNLVSTSSESGCLWWNKIHESLLICSIHFITIMHMNYSVAWIKLRTAECVTILSSLSSPETRKKEAMADKIFLQIYVKIPEQRAPSTTDPLFNHSMHA